jgi:2-methylisocitrate lyase-like PEP mutase family enzyme
MTNSLTDFNMSGNGNGAEGYMKPSTRLRKLLSQDGVCVQAPGVYDGICARIAIEQGFQVMVSSKSFMSLAIPFRCKRWRF